MTPVGLFEIIDGVRRAKAFELSGAATVRVVLQRPDGTQGPEIEVPIDALCSPHKAAVDLSTPAQRDRFFRIVNAIRAGQGARLPPLVVRPGTRGTRIKDLSWIY
jgi:hypothetical protein